jgi:myo-inositol 2-dehydrogenase/D-chiro-inositol 1-dehydrogenase
MGRQHVVNLAAIADVVVDVVADHDAKTASDVAAIVGARGVTDSLAVARDASLDAIVIASPDDTHADLAIAAIEAGLPVLCEKPLAGNVADARRVAEAESAAGRELVQVGFMRQYDPLHRQVADALPDLGVLQHVRCVHRNTNHDWMRPLEVVFSQSLIHDIHTVRWLTGSEFVSVVTQTIGRERPVDHVVVLGRLADGSSATIEFVEATYGYDIEVEVTSSHGAVSCAQPPHPVVRRDGAGHRHVGMDWFGRFTTAYRAEVESWVEGVRSGVVAGPGVADGLAAQCVAAAAIESAVTGARVSVDV